MTRHGGRSAPREIELRRWFGGQAELFRTTHSGARQMRLGRDLGGGERGAKGAADPLASNGETVSGNGLAEASSIAGESRKTLPCTANCSLVSQQDIEQDCTLFPP